MEEAPKRVTCSKATGEKQIESGSEHCGSCGGVSVSGSGSGSVPSSKQDTVSPVGKLQAGKATEVVLAQGTEHTASPTKAADSGL